MKTPIHRALLLSITLFIAATTNLYAASRDTPSSGWANVDKTTLNLAANSTIEPIEVNEIDSTPRVLVEAILFSNNKQPETREITWLAGERALVPEPNLIPLVSSYQRSDELLQMAQKINGSKHYTMINNQAWLQTVATDDQQSPVRLKLKWQGYDIDGVVAVFKSRSLHVMSDIRITRTPSDEAMEATNKTNTELVVIPSTIPASDPSEPATNDPLQADNTNTDSSVPSVHYAPVTARLKETRKVQNNQWNFFDHPNFGLLLKISTFDN